MTDVPFDPLLRLAVTGTDTGVGKTLVTCALVAALRAAGHRVAAMKPIETGVADGRHVGGLAAAETTDGVHGGTSGDATDAERLRHAAGDVHPIVEVCPITFAEPLAPLVAADRAGRAVDLARLDDARARLTRGANAFVVEGAGGLLVPLARDAAGTIVDLASLAARWHLDVVVVAANRLGVLNHALLTVREAERRGLIVRAVVLNTVRASTEDVAESTNADALRGLVGDVPVLAMPFVPLAARDDLALLAALGRPLADLLSGVVARRGSAR